MFGSSMMLTIGQALEQARENQANVQVNVSGVWIGGRVLNADGVAAVLSNGVDEVTVVRLEAINCVRIPIEPTARAQPAAPTETDPESITAGHELVTTTG